MSCGGNMAGSKEKQTSSPCSCMDENVEILRATRTPPPTPPEARRIHPSTRPRPHPHDFSTTASDMTLCALAKAGIVE